LPGVFARNDLIDDFATLAIANFGGIHDAGSVFRRHGDAVDQDVNRVRIRVAEVDFDQRFRRREFVDLAILVETVETVFSQIAKAFFQCIGDGFRRSSSFLCARFLRSLLFRRRLWMIVHRRVSRTQRLARFNREECMQPCSFV
jgi:hypothetical protein